MSRVSTLLIAVLVPIVPTIVPTIVSAQTNDEIYRGTSDWSGEGAEGDEDVDVDEPSGPYPIRYTLRPLTLNRLQLRGDAVLTIFRRPEIAIANDDNVASMLAFGAAFGITDDFEIGLSGERLGSPRSFPLLWPDRGVGEGLISLHFSPDFDFGDIPLYARFRFLRDRIQIAAELAVLIPANTDAQIRIGVPVRLGLADAFAIDTGIAFGLVFADSPSDPGDDFFAYMDVPIRLLISPIEALTIGVYTALRFIEFDKDFFAIPLGFEAIVSMNISSLLFDFFAGLEWPAFFLPTNDNDKLRQATWMITAGARLHFQIGGSSTGAE